MHSQLGILDRCTYRYICSSQKDYFQHSNFHSFAMAVVHRSCLKTTVPSALRRLGGVKEYSFSLLSFLLLSILSLEKSQLLTCQNSFKSGLWCIETCETEPWQLCTVKGVWLLKKKKIQYCWIKEQGNVGGCSSVWGSSFMHMKDTLIREY